MPRTSVYIEDRLYKKLVEESISKYGSTKHISKVLNEKLLLAEKLKARQDESLPVISIKKKMNWKSVERVVEREMKKAWKE